MSVDEPSLRGIERADPSEISKDLRLFVGPNFDAFAHVLANAKKSWWGAICWSGFFFPVPWFLYRKMYGIAAFITRRSLGAFGAKGANSRRLIQRNICLYRLSTRRPRVAY